MSRGVRSILATVALAAAAGGGLATAVADDDPLPLDEPITADLDGDGADETVRAREIACFTEDGTTPPPCPRDALRTIVVEVGDRCARGPVALTLSREMDFVSLAEVVDADDDRRVDDLAFELRAGATARGVQAKVVRFRSDGGCVAVQKTLFSYPRPATIGRRPKGTGFATGSISTHDFDKGIRGLELRTQETYARPTDPGCCPSFRRTTFWRFVASTSSYRPYRTTLRRIPKPA